MAKHRPTIGELSKRRETTKQELETIADYVDDLFRQEVSMHCCPDCTTDFCLDCAEVFFSNDYIGGLVNLRVELRNRIAQA